MRSLLLCVVLVACSSSSKPGPGDQPDAAGPAIDGAVGKACRDGAACGAGEYCDFADNMCGAGAMGACVKKPDACPAVIGKPVCGCDKKVHSGECVTYVDGTDLDAVGGCTKQPGTFACGYFLCNLGTDYCRIEPHANGATGYACVALQCTGTPSCSCLERERCGDACTGDDKTGLTLTCPAT